MNHFQTNIWIIYKVKGKYCNMRFLMSSRYLAEFPVQDHTSSSVSTNALQIHLLASQKHGLHLISLHNSRIFQP